MFYITLHKRIILFCSIWMPIKLIICNSSSILLLVLSSQLCKFIISPPLSNLFIYWKQMREANAQFSPDLPHSCSTRSYSLSLTFQVSSWNIYWTYIFQSVCTSLPPDLCHIPHHFTSSDLAHSSPPSGPSTALSLPGKCQNSSISQFFSAVRHVSFQLVHIGQWHITTLHFTRNQFP